MPKTRNNIKSLVDSYPDNTTDVKRRLAAHLEVPMTTIHHYYAKPEVNPPAKYILPIAQFFRVDPSEVLTPVEEESSTPSVL